MMSTRKLRKLAKLLHDIPRNADIEKLALDLYRGLNTPMSRTCRDLLLKGDYDTLVRLEVSPKDYSDSDSYMMDRQAVDFLRKYPFEGFEKRCKLAAEEAFLSSEERCRDTNSLLRRYRAGRCNIATAGFDIIQMAKHKIGNVLGDLDVSEWIDSCRFGPGVTIGSRNVSDYRKLAMDPSTTEEFEPYSLEFLAEFEGWIDSWTYNGSCTSVYYTVYPGGKFATVPKDAKTDRPIETQPLLNGFAQLGLGSIIRRKLKAIGIDLDDQTRNRDLACSGSLTGKYATLDLKSASDLIATELVRELLPPDWFHAMNITRTHQVLFKGDWVPLERFCSMGNGFTFELESLIFWAVSKSMCDCLTHRPVVSVYGDDIIVPSSCALEVIAALESCGFLVNHKKSHLSGPFRESCGGDFWNGKNVRPYFQKKELENAQDVISLVNGLVRSARRASGRFGTDARFAPSIYRAIRWLHPTLRKALAHGAPSGGTDDDGFILWHKTRAGARVVAQTVKYPVEHYYPGKATILYRAHRKGEFGSRGFHLDKVQNGGNGHIFDYRRDSVTLTLQLQPHWYVTSDEVWRGWL